MRMARLGVEVASCQAILSTAGNVVITMSTNGDEAWLVVTCSVGLSQYCHWMGHYLCMKSILNTRHEKQHIVFVTAFVAVDFLHRNSRKTFLTFVPCAEVCSSALSHGAMDRELYYRNAQELLK